ncbi:MAG: hypothetical protein QOC79_2917, partial [Actinomycetota bacterium]|nr:hypothetical protein [Actinomycetota bacterium]
PDVDSPSRMQSVRVDLADGDHITPDALRAVRDDLKRRLDSMNEMSELVSLRLQMIMDRRSKFLETLSKLLKKMPDTDTDTDSGIVQNVK